MVLSRCLSLFQAFSVTTNWYLPFTPMKYIVGKNRDQVTFSCLEELIEPNNEVRLIDLFVNSLTLSDFGFETPKQNEQGGRPAYQPSDLLKLFIYGYLNRIRSSRQLEKECVRNLEVKWLMRELVPDHI